MTKFYAECVYGTNTVCTPFSYNGDVYDDCIQGSWYNWCLVDGQTGSDYFYCGDCVGKIEENTTKTLTTEDIKPSTSGQRDMTTIEQQQTSSIDKKDVKKSMVSF